MSVFGTKVYVADSATRFMPDHDSDVSDMVSEQFTKQRGMTILPNTKVVAVLENYRREGIDFHALRTRESGTRRFVEVHVLVPGCWTVQRGHEYVEQLEADIRAVLPQSTVLTHLEPIEDPASLEDISLDR